MIDPNNWTMAERIAENSKIYKTPQEVIAAFNNLMNQVQADRDNDE